MRTYRTHLWSILMLGVMAIALGGWMPPALATAHAHRAITTPTAAGDLGDPADLTRFFAEQLGDKLAANHIPGATLSVVHNGQMIVSQGYGVANLQTHSPIDPASTVFRAGSVSKVFTATAVMQLAEEGKLDLHTDVNTYLRAFKIPATFPQAITLTHLLTHTAGFEERNVGFLTYDPHGPQPLGTWLAAHMPARIYPPGQTIAYSNYGNSLAGYIVEVVSGEPYATYIQRHILAPLHMDRSTFAQPLPAPLATALAQGYRVSDTGYQAQPFEMVQVTPAGSLSTTASDMAHFMIAHLQGGQYGTDRILSAQTTQLMHQQQVTGDPQLPGMAYGFYELDIDGHRILAHNGGTVAFESLLVLLPEQNSGFFVSTNSDNGGGLINGELLTAFVDRYLGATTPAAVPVPAGFAERASHVAGSYWTTRRSMTTIEKIASLVGEASVRDTGNGTIVVNLGTTDIRAVEIAPWTYREVDGTKLFVFHHDSQDTVTALYVGLGPLEWTKIAWYETRTFHLGVIALSLVIFLSALAGWLICWWRLRRTAQPQPVRGALVIGWLTCLLFILGSVALVVALANLEATDASATMYIALTTLLAAAVLTVGMLVSAVRMWRTAMPVLRVHYALVTLTALAFVGELQFWNFLGWHF